MKFKRHKTVDDLLSNSLPDSKETINAMNRLFDEDDMSRHLYMLRSKAGVSQKEMANRLNVSQSVISKMENKGEYLKFNDVIRYINALDFSVEFAAIKGNRSVDILGSYFSRIKAMMSELQRIAGSDPDITKGVMSTFISFSKSMLEDVIPQLKTETPKRKSTLMISIDSTEKEDKKIKPRTRKDTATV